MKITSETQSRTLLFGGVIAALIVGVVGGYFAAHVGMSEMPGMTTGKGDVKGTDIKAMQGMEGTKGMQPGAVAIPTATRQVIRVSSAQGSYAASELQIRA